LGRSHPKATSPSLSLSPAFFPAHTLPNPSPPRALGAPAPGRYRAPCPLRYVARLDPSLSLLPFFSRVPERVSPFLPRGAALSSPDHHRACRCHITVSRPNSPPHLRPVVVGQTCLPFFPRMGTRQAPATLELAGRHALPRCLPSLLSARRLLLLTGRRRQSPTATARTITPRTRASPPSVGAGASRPH
jgi:hypothetical protein